MLALVLLFSTAGLYESVHTSSLQASEVWAHLRTGTWMLEHHAIPRSGLFSQEPGLPWNDSSWLFDLLIGAVYRLFGLRAIPLLLIVLEVGVAAALFWLARSRGASFWLALTVSAAAQYVIFSLQPLPYVFSILLFAVELTLLLRVRESGTSRDLYWLPLLFIAWSNLHAQFAIGLCVLALFLIALLLEYRLASLGVPWCRPPVVRPPIRTVTAVSVLSLLGACATPYGPRLLLAFLSSYTKVGFEHFTEMSAMSFRRPQDYMLMLLVMMAFLALGRRRSLEVFELFVLLGGTAIAFRIQRDGWIAVLAAVAVVSQNLKLRSAVNESQSETFPARYRLAVAGTMALLLVIAAFRLPHARELMDRVRQSYPVAACNYIASNKLPHPLFNEYSFGSFLTWYLRAYPVVVDSRVELYGDETLKEYFDVIGGKERLDAHPMVSRAGTLLLQHNSAMAKALTNLPALRSRYRLVYSDDLASVFVPEP